jgi:hypothetical protein
MTPKEKAEELVNKYADNLPRIFYNVVESKNYYSAKLCALIAIDETINSLSILFGTTKELSFYLKVKQEIEKYE